MAKSKEQLEARRLRRSGESIKQIAKKLCVSTSSVSLWCRDIVLTQEQIRTLEQRAKDPYYGRRLAYSQKQKKERILKTHRLQTKGIAEVGSISNRDLFIAGTALYWAEGFKKDSQVGLANSDPGMIRFFIRWAKNYCHYKMEDISVRVTINMSHKDRVVEIQKYWSNICGIPLNQFQKPFFQRTQWKKIYENKKTYYGVLRVKLRRSTDLLRKIHGLIEGLKLNSV